MPKKPKPASDGDAHLELVQARGLQEIFGVSRQRVSQLVREKGFPEPYGRLPTGHVWQRDVIERWYEENRGRFRPAVPVAKRKRR